MLPTMIADSEYKLAIVMVGLPARGKTYCARNISRYLKWLGVKSQCFSIADYRANFHFPTNNVSGGASFRTASPCLPILNADYFDFENERAMTERSMFAEEAFNDLVKFFNGGGGMIGLLDASHVTKGKRRDVHKGLQRLGIQVIFLECINGGEESAVIRSYVDELCLLFREYEQMRIDFIVNNYVERIGFYRRVYVSIGDDEGLSYIKYVDGGAQIDVNQVRGYLPSRVLFYLMNIHTGNRCIYLCPHKVVPGREVACVWAGPEHESLEHPSARLVIKSALKHQCEGETVHDLIVRLETVIMELEATKEDIAILSDHPVLLAIYHYFRPCEVGVE
jgi:6-phosphofructo-2-kinase